MPDNSALAILKMSDGEAGEDIGFGTSVRSRTRGAEAKRLVLASTADAGPMDILPNLKPAAKEALDALLCRYPRFIVRISGYLPNAAATMAIVTDRMGERITSANLTQANEVCSGLVDEVMGPLLAKFIDDELSLHPGQSITKEALIAFLLGPYAQFSKARSNSLMSRAGSLNEALVREALKFENLTGAVQTGTEGNADIQIVAQALTPPAILSIEVKSYGARERLVRGLHDCNSPKVGVGFFNRASEFNADRTSQLLATNASAIYLPEATLAGLTDTVRQRQNSHGGVFYRPLSAFGPDMLNFTKGGMRVFS